LRLLERGQHLIAAIVEPLMEKPSLREM